MQSWQLLMDRYIEKYICLFKRKKHFFESSEKCVTESKDLFNHFLNTFCLQVAGLCIPYLLVYSTGRY